MPPPSAWTGIRSRPRRSITDLVSLAEGSTSHGDGSPDLHLIPGRSSDRHHGWQPYPAWLAHGRRGQAAPVNVGSNMGTRDGQDHASLAVRAAPPPHRDRGRLPVALGGHPTTK